MGAQSRDRDEPGDESSRRRPRSDFDPARPPLTRAKAIAKIGRYDVIGRLAQGGMAEIYLARQGSGRTSRIVVVKLLKAHVLEDETKGDFFIEELRLGMKLSHPNICHIYDVGFEGREPYIVMEWVNGVTLSSLMKRAKDGLPIPETAKIIAQVAGALEYAHTLKDDEGERLGLVHRDVSPQNIMVSFDGTVKLLDFGVARVEKQGTEEDSSNSIAGKFAYLSPEQATGRSVDGRSDLFSLGICFFESVTRRRLFRADDDFGRLEAVVKREIPNIRTYRPDAPVELAEIVAKSLQRLVGRRYQTGLEMRRAIDAFLVSSGEVVDSQRLAELLKKHFAEEIASGPQIDARPVVAARFEELGDELSSVRDLVPRPVKPSSPPEIHIEVDTPKRRWLAPLLAVLLIAGGAAAAWLYVSDPSAFVDLPVIGTSAEATEDDEVETAATPGEAQGDDETDAGAATEEGEGEALTQEDEEEQDPAEEQDLAEEQDPAEERDLAEGPSTTPMTSTTSMRPRRRGMRRGMPMSMYAHDPGF